MKNHTLTFLVLLASALLTGCVAGQGSSVDRQDMSINALSSSAGQVKNVKVLSNSAGIVVKGNVQKLHDFKIPGHVDVTVYGPGGEMLEEARGTLTQYASRRGGRRTASFSAMLHSQPPQGSEVQVQYHSDGHTHSNS